MKKSLLIIPIFDADICKVTGIICIEVKPIFFNLLVYVNFNHGAGAMEIYVIYKPTHVVYTLL